MRKVLGALILATTLVGFDPSSPSQAAALQAALDQWASDSRHHGVSATVIFSNGTEWTGVAGLEAPGKPIRPEHLFWLASITKTMTGAVTLQLVQESKLSLDDTIGRWLAPDSKINPRITIRQLLNHTSGVPNYEGGRLVREKNDPTYVLSADELLATVGAPLFEPGARTQYGNTAFVLLGSIAAKITGQPLHRLFRERLWGPIGVTDLFLAGHEPPPGPVADAYGQTGRVQPMDNVSMISAGFGAGGVFATSRAVARWGRALFTGTVVSPETQRAMRTLVPAAGNIPGESGAGLGIRGYDFLGRQQYGHSGGALLGSSLMFFDPSSGVTVAVLTNQGFNADHFVLAPRLLELATRSGGR